MASVTPQEYVEEVLRLVESIPEGRVMSYGAVADALADAAAAGVAGPAVTPHLLAAVERATGGRSLAANLALLEANARLAAEVAVALAGA